MGEGGAVILAILVTAIAIPTAIRCRKRKAEIAECNEARGLHSSNALVISSNQAMEDDYNDSVTLEGGILNNETEINTSSNNIPSSSKQSGDVDFCAKVNSTR